MARLSVNSTWTVVWFLTFLTTVVITIIFGAYEFIPAWKTRNFLPIKCEIVDITKKDLHCVCGDQCFSRFTCLTVVVEFEDIFHSNVTRREKSADDETTLLFYGEERSCTYYPPCDFSTDKNNAAIKEYMKVLKLQEMVTCHVNKGNQLEVILNKNKTKNKFLLLATGALLFLVCQVALFLFAKGLCSNITNRNINRLLQC